MTRGPSEVERERILRRAVVQYVRSERRRVHPAVLHVGLPGGTETVFALDPDEATDHSLRTDVLAAMLRRTSRGPVPPVVWLTRVGELDLQDVDAQWHAAARAAFGEAELEVSMVVVNRHGWRDPATGDSKHWVRLR